jgi:hypothetical protein
MKRRKPGKTLARIAREINDSDEFLEHVGNLSERYRREYAMDTQPRGSAARRSLQAFRKHATALVAWLEQAHKESRASGERDALNKIAMQLQGAPHHAASTHVLDWLAQAEKAATRCLEDPKLLPRKAPKNAPRIAAAGLRATFEHHQLKFSATIAHGKPSSAVRLLCAIAKNAGDPSLTAVDARQSLLESGARPPTN